MAKCNQLTPLRFRGLMSVYVGVRCLQVRVSSETVPDVFTNSGVVIGHC